MWSVPHNLNFWNTRTIKSVQNIPYWSVFFPLIFDNRVVPNGNRKIIFKTYFVSSGTVGESCSKRQQQQTFSSGKKDWRSTSMAPGMYSGVSRTILKPTIFLLPTAISVYVTLMNDSALKQL